MKCYLFFLLALIGTCLSAESNPPPQTTTSTTTTTTTTTTTPGPDPTTMPTPPVEVPVLLHLNLTTKVDNVTYTCAMFNFVAKIELRKVNSTETIPLLNTTTVDLNKSSCKENITILHLNINGASKRTLQMQFNHSNPSTYSLDDITYEDGHKFESNVSQITIDANKAYLCSSSQEIELSKEGDLTGYLILKDFKVDAFRNKDDGSEFRNAVQECEADYPQNDFVPLAVGCALISLVFIVLIAYIVGRKRSRRLTYQSV